MTAAPNLTLVGARASAPTAAKVVRPAEWIISAFLLYAPALTFFLPAPDGLRTRLASLNLAAILVYAGLIFLDLAKPRLALTVIRDWLPLGMIFLAYREALKATTDATRTVFGENGKSRQKDSRPPATGRGSLPRSTGSLRRHRRLPK